MDAINAFERLQMLVDFIRTFPTREQLVVFMSENICPHGELAGVNTAYLDDYGVIQIQFHHGFNLKNSPRTTINITEDNPGAECLRTMKIIYLDLKSLYEQYTQAINVGEITDYQTAIGIPVTTRRTYGFTFVNHFSNFEDFKEYFECLRSILAFWELINGNTSTKHIPPLQMQNRELTSRQARILELIKEDRTNASIATILGYSESLIRQETIIIYKKLGIDGRRELKKTIAS